MYFFVKELVWLRHFNAKSIWGLNFYSSEEQFQMLIPVFSVEIFVPCM